MDCNNFKFNISAFLDGELSKEEAEKISEHINTCENCKKVYESYSNLSKTIKSSEAELPEGFKVLMPKKNIFSILRGHEMAASAIAAAVALMVFAGGISKDIYMSPSIPETAEMPETKIFAPAEPRQETKEIEKKTTKELNGGDEVLKSPSDVSVEIVNAHDTENTYEEEVVAMDENNEALQSDNFSGKNENIDQDKNALSVAQEGRSVPVSGGGGSSNPVSEILNFDMPDITGFYDEAVYLSLCEKLNALKEKARTYGYSEEIMNEFEEFKTEIISAKK